MWPVGVEPPAEAGRGDEYPVSRGWLQFGPFAFDPLSLELKRAGRKVRLRPQSARALALLLEAPGHEVSRQALRSHLWGNDTYVDYETGLNTCIRRLRTTLGDDARRPRYLLTLPGHGYRFIMPVTTESEAAETTARPTRAATPEGSSLEPVAATRHGTEAGDGVSSDQDTRASAEDVSSGNTPRLAQDETAARKDGPKREPAFPTASLARMRSWRTRLAWATSLAACVVVLFSLTDGREAKDLAAPDHLLDAPTHLQARIATPAETDPGPGILTPTPTPTACPSPSSRPIFAIVAKVEGLPGEPEIGRTLLTKFRTGLRQSADLQLMPGARFRTGLARLTSETDRGKPSRDHILRLGRMERADAVILIRVSRSPFPGNADLFFTVEIIDVASQRVVFDRQIAGESAAALDLKVGQTVRQAARALHDLAPQW